MDRERLWESLTELEDVLDQLILYADPEALDPAKLDTAEAAAFASKCREAAHSLAGLRTRLQRLVDGHPQTAPERDVL